MRNFLLAVLVVIMAVSCAFAEGEKYESKYLDVELTTNQINLYENIPFAQGYWRGSMLYALHMDVLVPDSKEPMPLIVFITGGGFIMAPKNNWIQQRMRLAQAGYVVASIEYRYAPLSKFPLPLEDCKTAIRWLRAHADMYNIDVNRVGVLGNSAGGYLSAFVGLTNGMKEFDKGDFLDYSSDVLCAADIFGISDITNIGMDYDEENQKGHASAGATEALWALGTPTFGGKDGGVLAHPEESAYASPITYVEKNKDRLVPMLLMHGTADTLVSPGQTDILFQALKAKGADVERYVVNNAAHGGPYWVQEPVMKVMVDFFDKYLKK
ncbi:MAG: alpha/beta hydrolase [Synergistaceae bacterium]|nr:alpha/beta hydrolase [Synergistaceae bacterium]MBR0069274.1 alpha/beta hydrolase [Synergistaceae bacterium]